MGIIKALIVVTVIIAIAVVAFVYSGAYSVAADEPHLGVVEKVLETVRKQSIQARLDGITVPDDLGSEERVRRGAQSYAAMCQECHLAPGVEPTPLHQGLNPKPPELDHAASHGTKYVFWTIKHGIKMTGMPAWGETHADDELWDLTAFIQKLPTLSVEEYSVLSEGAEAHDHSAHDHMGTQPGKSDNASAVGDVRETSAQQDKGDQADHSRRGHEGDDHSH